MKDYAIHLLMCYIVLIPVGWAGTKYLGWGVPEIVGLIVFQPVVLAFWYLFPWIRKYGEMKPEDLRRKE